jgi:hypothetical protein
LISAPIMSFEFFGTSCSRELRVSINLSWGMS